MRKSVLLLTAVFCLGQFVNAWSENLLLEHTQFFVHHERAGVIFPHDQHMEELDCLDCHHRYENGRNVLEEDALEDNNPDIRCGHCHTVGSEIELQKAFHRQCISCHIAVKRQGLDNGPVLCAGCHLKP